MAAPHQTLPPAVKNLSNKMRTMFIDKLRRPQAKPAPASPRPALEDTADEEQQQQQSFMGSHSASPRSPARDHQAAHSNPHDDDLIPAQTSPLGAALSLASSPSVRHMSPVCDGMPATSPSTKRSIREEHQQEVHQEEEDAVHSSSIPPLPELPMFDEFSPLSMSHMQNHAAAVQRAQHAEQQVAALEATVVALQARMHEEHCASLNREEALTRQHQAELDLLNAMIGEERQRLVASEQELLELKTMLVWGEADSSTPTFVRYRDFECLQQKLTDLQQQLRQVMQQGLDPQGPQGLVAREYIRLRGRVLELQRVIDVLLLVLCNGVPQQMSTRASQDILMRRPSTSSQTSSRKSTTRLTYQRSDDVLTLASVVLASNAAQGTSGAAVGPSLGGPAVPRSPVRHAGLASLQRQLQEAEEALDVVRRSPPRRRGPPLRGARSAREASAREQQTMHAPARSTSGGKVLDETAMFASHPGLVFGALGAPLQAPAAGVENKEKPDAVDESVEDGVQQRGDGCTQPGDPEQHQGAGSGGSNAQIHVGAPAAPKPSGGKQRGKKAGGKAARGGGQRGRSKQQQQQQQEQQLQQEQEQHGVAKTFTMRPVNESVEPPPPPAIVTAAAPCLPVIMHQGRFMSNEEPPLPTRRSTSSGVGAMTPTNPPSRTTSDADSAAPLVAPSLQAVHINQLPSQHPGQHPGQHADVHTTKSMTGDVPIAAADGAAADDVAADGAAPVPAHPGTGTTSSPEDLRSKAAVLRAGWAHGLVGGVHADSPPASPAGFEPSLPRAEQEYRASLVGSARASIDLAYNTSDAASNGRKTTPSSQRYTAVTSSSEGSVHAEAPPALAQPNLTVLVRPKHTNAVGVRASEESVSSVCMEEESPTAEVANAAEGGYDPVRVSQALGLTGPVTLERLQDAVASSPKAVVAQQEEDVWEDARSVATLHSCGSLTSMRSGG